VVAYSGGFIVATNSVLYGVYLKGSKVELTSVNGIVIDMFVTDSVVYMFTRADSTINVIAYDIKNNSTILIGSIEATSIGTSHSDSYIVYINNTTKEIVKASSCYSTGSYPTVFYGAGSSVIYCDLTKQGTLPYPMPEPWITTIAIPTVIVVTIASIVKKFEY